MFLMNKKIPNDIILQYMKIILLQEMMTLNRKYLKFLLNARELNEKFNITPLLYGSLGLEILSDSSLNADDIDILIPEVYVKGEKWIDFKAYLESNGYVLIDEHEHTFRKSNTDFSYASIENLKEFAGIDIGDIGKKQDNDADYLLLSLEQYLRVYEKSSQDGYRVNKKEKQDNAKIKFINARICEKYK